MHHHTYFPIFRSSLQIQYPCKIYRHQGFTPYQHSRGPCWYQLGSAKGNHTYHLYVPYPVPFHVCRSDLVPHASTSLIQKLITIQNYTLRIATGCAKMTSIDHLQKDSKMLPVQCHLSLINSQYLARALQHNNSR